MEDGFFTAMEICLAVDFLPPREFFGEYAYIREAVANLTADRILALLTELLPAGPFILRKGRAI